MAVLTSGTTFPIDFTTLDLTGLRDGDILPGASSTSFGVDELDGTINTITGIGFAFDVFGDPTGGTVTGWQQTDGGTLVFNLTGVNDSLVSLVGFVDALDTNGFLSTLASGADSFTGSPFADHLLGYAGNDTIIGGNGADTLDGGAGADSLNGGAGVDFAGYASSAISVNVSLTSPGSNTGDAVSDAYTSIEGLIGSGFNDTLEGDGGANPLHGGVGNDLLIGGAGADGLDGGAGFDFASYEPSAAGVSASLSNPGGNSGDAAGDTYTAIEGIRGSSFSDTLEGNGGSNILIGNQGNDMLRGLSGNDALWGVSDTNTLDGGAGSDTLNGGTGTDTASYATSSVGVFATQKFSFLNNGDAAGDSFVSIENMLGSSFNDLLGGTDLANNINGGAGNDWLFGFAGNDTLVGGSGNDTLNGGAGADSLDGGGGIDLASYKLLGTSGVNASLVAPGSNTGDAAGDVYTSIEGFRGTDFNDTLEGDAAANSLAGAGGDDILSGGAGADTLNGGAGTDTASYASSGSGLWALQNFGFLNNGDAAGDAFTKIENMLGSSFNDLLGGNDLANIIDGGAGSGADWLFGFLGDDTLIGGLGDDTLNGGAGADSLNGGAGFDFASYKLLGSAGVNASLTTPGSNTGDALGDSYVAIEGLRGTDFNDTLEGDGAGNTLIGNQGDDSLLGLGGADSLVGGGGADTLEGGTGNDTLNGGGGDDTFIYDLGDGADTINGFVAGALSDDVLNLGISPAFDTFLEVQAVASQVGLDTVIDFSGGDTITLVGVTAANLHADDFIFG